MLSGHHEKAQQLRCAFFVFPVQWDEPLVRANAFRHGGLPRGPLYGFRQIPVRVNFPPTISSALVKTSSRLNAKVKFLNYLAIPVYFFIDFCYTDYAIHFHNLKQGEYFW